jgi:hypothetical protein
LVTASVVDPFGSVPGMTIDQRDLDVVASHPGT